MTPESLEEISALMLPSMRPTVSSAWHGHVAFAHWIVQVTRPRIIVELGTHNGLSYSAFCNALHKFNISGNCYAVDTWTGDEHAGKYGEEIFQSLNKFNNKHFTKIGKLIRSYFDEALDEFEEGSIDILHIDGLHTYEAVRHDFETWLPKLSKQNLVIFHDTEVYDKNFGVWKFFEEKSHHYPNFNFKHGYGLGVLAVGAQVAEAVLALCRSKDLEAENIRTKFSTASDYAYHLGYIHLRTSYRDHLHPSLRNLALHCKVNLSSDDSAARREGRSSVVDGHKDGTFGFHTNREDNPWILLDLGKVVTIKCIFIFNRIDPVCMLRAQTINIHASMNGLEWDLIYTHDGTIFGGIDGDPLTIPADRTVRLLRFCLKGNDIFHLDQIEIY